MRFILAALALLASPANAEELVVAGHTITITDPAAGVRALGIDGATVHENLMIFLDEPVKVGAVDVVTGRTASGGSGCEGNPFVIAAPQGGKAELFGPVDTCLMTTITSDDRRLTISEDVASGITGRSWVWTQASGLTEGAAVQGAVDASASFADLAATNPGHPMDALANGAVMAAVREVTGNDFPRYLERLNDLGSGEMQGTVFVGESCLKETCEQDKALLYVDTATGEVFTAFSVDGEVWTHPHAERWPEGAALELDGWITQLEN